MIDSPIPSPRRAAERFVGGKVTMTSPFDPRVKLHIDPQEFDFHIEFPTDVDERALSEMTEVAWSRGYCLDTGTDPYDLFVAVDETTMRAYLAPVEPVPDTPLEENLPDLSLTAYGPFSGFMEAVSA